jgi:hypothetical protein
MGLAPDCEGSDPYLGVPYYDDDTSQCNSLATSFYWQIVGDQAEPYIGSVCAGVVDSYWVPPSAAISPLFAPLLPPYVLQTVTEQALTSIENMIPKYFYEDCLLSQRKVLCGSFFLKPEASDALAFLFGTIYLPSFPQRDVCESYQEQCSSLISLAPALSLNCTQQSSDGIDSYPETSQVSFFVIYFMLNDSNVSILYIIRRLLWLI